MPAAAQPKQLSGILYWQYFFTPPGGWGNRRSYDFARYWRAYGREVWILAGGTYFPPGYPKPWAFRADGVGIVWLPAPYHQKLSLWKRAWHFLRFSLWSVYILWRLRRRSLYVVATLPPPTLPVLAALGRTYAGRRFSVDVYDAWPQVLSAKFAPFVYAPVAWLLRWSFRRADYLFALSPDIAPYLPADKVKVSFNGTRPELFYRRQIPPYLPFRIIYAGTLGWVNGVDFLLRVAHELRQYRSIEFWIIGDGMEKENLVAAARDLPSVRFLPPVPVEEVSFWLSQGHIGVSLVRPIEILATNSANKFYDYLANGLVVGINYGGWQAEVLRRLQLGFSAPSVHAFAAGILRYYWDRGQWLQAVERAKLWAQKEYDRKKLAADVLGAIEAILQE